MNRSAEEFELIADFSTVLQRFAAPGRVAVTLGGSRAKRTDAARSDFDFRLYADQFITESWTQSPGWAGYCAAKEKWRARGHRLDDFWPRKIADIEGELARWCAGGITPQPLVWSVWGYHLPTDIACQQSVHDPDGIVAGWHARLAIYPAALKQAIVREHLGFLRYWRADYHYESKVARGDRIFLAGLSAKLAHSLCQVLCAVNEVYYPGDGWNARYARGFARAPDRFADRLEACLYPGSSDDDLVRQHADLCALISEVEALSL